MAEKIGLEATFADAEFRRGIQNYIKSVDQAASASESAANRITASWDPNTLTPRIDELKTRVTALKQGHAELAAEVEKDTGGIGAAWEGLATAVGGLISVYMVKRLGEAIYSMGELGATVMRQEAAFEELARQAGGSADAILAAVQRATDGTVANSDIILAANKGILLGLGAQAEQWEKLAEVARFRARAMGLSVTQAISDITIGIGRQSRLVLDNLGIILDTEQVYADYADSIGKAADALTVAEQKQAFLTAVIRDGQAQIEAAGGIADDAADQFESLAAALKDAREAIATWVAPQIAPIIGQIADAIPGAVLRLQLLAAAVQGIITLDEMWTAAAESQRIQMEQGDEAAAAYVQNVIRFGEVVQVATSVHGDWNVGLNDTQAAIEGVTQSLLDFNSGMLSSMGVIAASLDLENQRAAALGASRQRLKQIAAAQEEAEKAEEERAKAQEAALRKMEQNEQAYARELESLYDQIVNASEQAQADRLRADEDYARDVLKLEQDLAREREKILLDLARDEEDDRREAAQKREDLARDLARDLADIEADLAEDNQRTWDDYYAELERMAEQHGQRLVAIEEKYANLRAGIEAKYRTGKTAEELRDEEREALLKQLEELRRLQEEGMTGIDYTQMINDVLAALEKMKEEELAALEEAKAAEVAAEEAAWQEEQKRAQERRDAELAANQEASDREAEQRRLAYERQLEDLRIAIERERQERELGAQRQLDDLRARGERERAELDAQHQARLAEIERNLQVETQAFRDAYNNELRDLQTYLNSRMQQWRDHLAAVQALLGVGSPSKWMMNLGKSMREGLDIGFAAPSLATDLGNAVARFGQMTNSLSLPMSAGGGGSTNSSTTHNHNLSVVANYSRMQNERSLREDLRLNQAMMRMRVGQ